MASPLTRLLAVYAVALAAVHVTVASPETCAAITPADARDAARDAADWIVANQHPDGSYVYERDGEGNDRGGYNIVRHAGVTLSLWQAARHLPDERERYLAAADRAFDWAADRFVERDGWLAFAEPTRATLGASALLLAGLAERRLLTGDARHDEVMIGLGRYIAALQRDDGGFYVAINPQTGDVDRVGTSLYYPGEALWAIARLANALPSEPEARAVATRAAQYIATERDEREDTPVPPLNDHWAAYGFAEMGEWGLTDEVVDYARAIGGRFHLLIRFEAQRDAGWLYGLTHGPSRRGAAVGTWVEGQAALWQLSRVEDRMADLEDWLGESARCGAAVLADRQVDDDAGPAKAGAWFTGGTTRMDDQQHPLSGLLAVAALAEESSDG